MILKTVRGLAAAVATVALVGGAQAADLGLRYSSSCVSYSQSTLPQQPRSVIDQTVVANFESAVAGMNDRSVQGSRQPAFIWAMEARWACSAAIGYLDGGHVDEESIQKCDCFHQRYLSFR